MADRWKIRWAILESVVITLVTLVLAGLVFTLGTARFVTEKSEKRNF